MTAKDQAAAHKRGPGRPAKADALSAAERVRRFRARKKEEGLTEVTGIYAPPELHAKLRELAEVAINEWKKGQ